MNSANSIQVLNIIPAIPQLNNQVWVVNNNGLNVYSARESRNFTISFPNTAQFTFNSGYIDVNFSMDIYIVPRGILTNYQPSTNSFTHNTYTTFTSAIITITSNKGYSKVLTITQSATRTMLSDAILNQAPNILTTLIIPLDKTYLFTTTIYSISVVLNWTDINSVFHNNNSFIFPNGIFDSSQTTFLSNVFTPITPIIPSTSFLINNNSYIPFYYNCFTNNTTNIYLSTESVQNPFILPYTTIFSHYFIQNQLQVNDCPFILPDISLINPLLLNGLKITILFPPQRNNLCLGIKSLSNQGDSYAYSIGYGPSYNMMAKHFFICDGTKWIQML